MHRTKNVYVNYNEIERRRKSTLHHFGAKSTHEGPMVVKLRVQIIHIVGKSKAVNFPILAT